MARVGVDGQKLSDGVFSPVSRVRYFTQATWQEAVAELLILRMKPGASGRSYGGERQSPDESGRRVTSTRLIKSRIQALILSIDNPALYIRFFFEL